MKLQVAEYSELVRRSSAIMLRQLVLEDGESVNIDTNLQHFMPLSALAQQHRSSKVDGLEGFESVFLPPSSHKAANSIQSLTNSQARRQGQEDILHQYLSQLVVYTNHRMGVRWRQISPRICVVTFRAFVVFSLGANQSEASGKGS